MVEVECKDEKEAVYEEDRVPVAVELREGELDKDPLEDAHWVGLSVGEMEVESLKLGEAEGVAVENPLTLPHALGEIEGEEEWLEESVVEGHGVEDWVVMVETEGLAEGHGVGLLQLEGETDRVEEVDSDTVSVGV